MADYIYLLEHRLSTAQQQALQRVREVARAQGVTVFLVGGAVRDLTSGSPVRDLDFVVQGNALLLKDAIKGAGGVLTGELSATQALFVRFAGGVRTEIGSTLSVSYPKPGKPVMAAATILDDLRRRDFTANAMALSLNEGSYGLLMDPLNGVADIENRQLRLVSNYGFIEEPVRMIRAVRFAARLGWAMDEKTQARYETGKQENYIKSLSATHRGYEAEEIFHEEDPLRILRRLEEEGWMKHLFPALTVAKANAVELEKLREVETQLQMRGIRPDPATANFPLLTAKMAAADVAELKRSFVRPGFAAEVDALEAEAKEFAGQLSGKGAALPSQAWKLLQTAKPEAVLWVAYSTKSSAIQAKLKSFYTDWPKARQKVPYTLMQEMRIVPELDGFDEIVEKLFYELMDGKLETVEELKAFLEVYSPPAPPPPVRLSRARTPKKDAKGAKGRKKSATEAEGEEEPASLSSSEEDEEESGAEEDEVESEEEATEVMPLRSSAPMRMDPVPEPREVAAAPDRSEESMPAVEDAPVAVAPLTSPVGAVDTPASSSAKKATPAAAAKMPAPLQKVAAPVKTGSLLSATKPTKKAVVKAVAKKATTAEPALSPKTKVAPKTVAPAKKAAAKVVAVKTAAKTVAAKKTVPAKVAASAKKAAAKSTPIKKSKR